MLVPADAQLSIAHNDARVHHPTSAMAPGTLMLGPMRRVSVTALLVILFCSSAIAEDGGISATVTITVKYFGAESIGPTGIAAIGNSMQLGSKMDAYVKPNAPDIPTPIVVHPGFDGKDPEPDGPEYIFDLSGGKRHLWLHVPKSDRGEVWAGPIPYDENGKIVQ